jgi:hypothetical protein
MRRYAREEESLAVNGAVAQVAAASVSDRLLDAVIADAQDC